MMLDEAFQVQDNSRLSCQIKFREGLDGLRVTLAPEFSRPTVASPRPVANGSELLEGLRDSGSGGG